MSSSRRQSGPYCNPPATAPTSTSWSHRTKSFDVVSTTSATQNAPLAERLLANEQRFAESADVNTAASAALGHPVEVGTDVTVTADANSDVLTFRAENADAEQAAVVADMYAAAYITELRERTVDDFAATADIVQDRIDDLGRQLASLTADDPARAALEQQRLTYQQALQELSLGGALSGGVSATVLAPAEVPTSPSQPQVIRNLVLGAVVGLILGVGLALLRETLDTRLRSRQDIERLVPGYPVLGAVPDGLDKRTLRMGRQAALVAREYQNSPAAEAYRSLRTGLTFLNADGARHVVQVSSSGPGEGKTTTAINMAITIAASGQRVLLIDADLRRPRVHEVFRVPRASGLTDVLAGAVPAVQASFQPFADLNLAVIPAGQAAPNPSELLGSSAFRQLLPELRAAADIVIFDSAPIVPVTDGAVLSALVDGTLLVASAKSTRAGAFHRALDDIAAAGGDVIGIVLNCAGRTDASGYGYGAYGDVLEPELPMPHHDPPASHAGELAVDPDATAVDEPVAKVIDLRDVITLGAEEAGTGTDNRPGR